MEVLTNKCERQGLGSAEAQLRRARFGPNVLPETPGKSFGQRFADQFRSADPLALLWVAGAVVLTWTAAETYTHMAGKPAPFKSMNTVTK